MEFTLTYIDVRNEKTIWKKTQSETLKTKQKYFRFYANWCKCWICAVQPSNTMFNLTNTHDIIANLNVHNSNAFKIQWLHTKKIHKFTSFRRSMRITITIPQFVSFIQTSNRKIQIYLTNLNNKSIELNKLIQFYWLFYFKLKFLSTISFN